MMAAGLKVVCFWDWKQRFCGGVNVCVCVCDDPRRSEMDSRSDLPAGVQERLFTQSTLRCVGVCVCLYECIWYKLPNFFCATPIKNQQTNYS